MWSRDKKNISSNFVVAAIKFKDDKQGKLNIKECQSSNKHS